MEDIQKIVEALLFASDTPLSVKKIKSVVAEAEEKEIRQALKAIEKRYRETDAPLQIIQVAGGYQIVTRKEFEPWVKQLFRTRSASRLTQKALETLAIIAYKQPITKQEVEAIRGVNVDGVMRTLIERNLITVKGRKKAPGNPLLYGTTSFFLNFFGLRSLKDLPKLKEIDELLKGDDKFLESLDQVALQQLMPEKLGLTSMLETSEDGTAPAASPGTESEEPPAVEESQALDNADTSPTTEKEGEENHDAS